MLISIVTGTYNRFDLLRGMIESARRYLHFGLAYEFVVVDGGSTDGTLEWCKTQADIVLIEHGGLHGAIKAFTDGAYQARGKYVLLANDDIQFIDYSILSSISYLENHPTCGAVAFADDRKAVSKPDGFHVQTMTVADVSGKQISVPYAQVGLYRRWLGDLCGWWGAYDPQFKSHTYGGDNYLTARILEYGYGVDAVKDVRVKDIVARDNLRDINIKREDETVNAGGGYYKRFLTPPQLKTSTVVDNPELPSGLRILYLPIFESKVYPHHRTQKRGLREALQRMGSVIEVDYLNEPYDLCELVRTWMPDILITQCQRDFINLTVMREAALIAPEMLVLNWNGDVYLDALVAPESLAWLQECVDLQLVVNAAALPTYQSAGIPAAYWQCGYEPVQGSVKISVTDAPDVVLMGSAYSQHRHELAQILIEMPYTVHLVGTGWVNYPDHNAGNTTYDFEVSNAIRRAAKIEVGDNQYPNDTGFVSNRVFDSLYAGGALLLHQRVHKLEDYTGLKAGVHYVEWTDYADLRAKIVYYLTPKNEAKRAKIVKAGAEYVRKHHSFDARLRELFGKIIPEVL